MYRFGVRVSYHIPSFVPFELLYTMKTNIRQQKKFVYQNKKKEKEITYNLDIWENIFLDYCSD